MDRPTRPLFRRQERRQRAGTADGRDVRVAAVRRQPPDLDRLVAALLAMALAELDAERRAVAGEDRPAEQSSGQ